MPRASSTCRPAAVVPPGDVTAARSDSGVSLPSPSSVLAPSSVCADERGSSRPREPDQHARFDHRFREQEHVRRSGPRQARDRVELCLGDAHDDPDRAEHPLGRARGRDRRRGCRRRWRPRHDRPVRRCSASPARPGDRAARASMAAIVTPAAIERIDAPSANADADAAKRGGYVARLHRDDEDLGVGGRPRAARDHTHLREPLLEHPPALGVDLGDGDRLGLPAGLDEAGRERLAHPSAAEQREVHRERVTVAEC